MQIELDDEELCSALIVSPVKQDYQTATFRRSARRSEGCAASNKAFRERPICGAGESEVSDSPGVRLGDAGGLRDRSHVTGGLTSVDESSVEEERIVRA